MIIFKHSKNMDEDNPLTWRNYKNGEHILECSPVIVDLNNHYLSIHNHIIDSDGTVHGPPGKTNSVKCPVCGWDETIILDDWNPTK